MVLSRLFGRGKDEPPRENIEAVEGPNTEAESAPNDDDTLPEEGLPEAMDMKRWRDRAVTLLPTGASTGSKRAESLWGHFDADAPTHFMRAAGCRVIATDGQEYIDCSMALGAVALGYAEPTLTRAAIEAAANGHVSGLSDVREVEVADRLTGVIPCAERVQFLKTGAEAMSAAVRIARAYTAREKVIAAGYFGWHDWASDAAGVPASTRALTARVPHDDLEALERAVREAGSDLACIVIEPVVEKLPSVEWIAAARRHCDEAGAVLIFDEIKTGFRLATGGYQQYADVTPDLAAFGKAMANGWPLSAVVGHKSVMDAVRNTWVSSTLASEGVSLAACDAVLDWHERAEVCESLAEIGREMQRGVSSAIEASGLQGVTAHGLDPMWLLRWDTPERESRFLELGAGQGVLFKRGAYNYASLAHDEDTLLEIESAASAACVAMRDEEQP
ncbi:MAG: aminotransferase class-III [Gemmatimonadetes bacterium]|nr:aminotransferase class-III [Gemmatimonadota bacterium]